jgi:stage II sporulation protein D
MSNPGAADQRLLLTPDAGSANFTFEDSRIRIMIGAQSWIAMQLRVTAPDGEWASFTLTVPSSQNHGSIRRRFLGCMDLRAGKQCLQPIVSMDVEIAVASIVDAESPPEAPVAFLMAQAIASRSFLLGAQHCHADYDFCDTTHCQFLRGPAAAGSPSFLAAARTEGLCIHFHGRPLAAMYSRSCSGRTNTLAQLGLPTSDYPYYPVTCAFCLHHPENWVRDSRSCAPNGERERVAFDRIHGWSAIPSNSFTQSSSQIEGRGIGHGLGLCQRGAAAMAVAGAGFDEILVHYYPNTSIGSA